MFKNLRREIKEWREDRRLERVRARQIRDAVENFHKTKIKVFKKPE